ncbi:MAG: GNAT family N-acetyltransferase [Verrucomicrobia bacterium]|nr:GNAT family N-acetyltransferase [Verrucomicrobiota bacterium]
MAITLRAQPVSPYATSLNLSIWRYLQNRTPISWETKQWLIRAVQPEDKDFFQALFVDLRVMRNITDHEARFRTLTPEQWKQQQTEAADKRVMQLVTRWVEGDPFSGFVIIEKSSGERRAHVTAGHTNPPTPGKTEIAYMVPRDRWHQGYGTLAFKFILRYLDMLAKIYQTWSGFPLEIDGAPLSGVVAVSRKDNKFSVRILKKKMKKNPGEVEKWNVRLVVFQMPVNASPAKL